MTTEKNRAQDRAYWCFISYRHTDNRVNGRQWATWLHKELETYEVPDDLVGTVNGRGDKIPKRLYPVFRDEDELPADAELSAPIEEALRRSRSLVVICSPAASASRFVDDEVRIFKKIGKADRVLAMIIAGEPNASDSKIATTAHLGPVDECFPLSLRRRVDPEGRITEERAEPVAADFRLPDGTEGWTSPQSYALSLSQAGTAKAEASKRVTEYEARCRLMKLKIIAGVLGIPLGVLTKRDQEYELEKAKKRARSLRRWLIAVSMAMLAAIVATLVALWQWRQADRAAHRAVAARSQAEELIEFMTFKMRNNLQSIGRLDLMDQINSEVEKYNLSKASAAETFGGNESTKEIFRAAANLSNKGDSLKAKGKLAEAYDVYRQALELDKKAVALEPENLTFVHGLSVVSAKLGDCAEQLGDLFMADVYYKHCIATRRDLVDREPDNPRWSLELAKAYRAKAQLLFDQEKFDEADDETRVAQRSLDKIEPARSDNPEYLHGRAATYSLLGDILARKEAFADARHAYGQVMSIALRLCSMEPANVNWQQALSVAHANLARLARQERDYPLARKHFDEALNIAAKLASADPLNENRRFSVFLSQEALGDLARESGDKQQALGRYRQAMEVLDGLLATDAGASNYLWLVNSATTAGDISELLRTQGSEDQAAKWSERAERDEGKAKKIWEANQKLSE